MRALITGISGFVGQYLEKRLLKESNMVFGTSRSQRKENNYLCLNLLCEQEIVHLLKNIRPSHIFHLAGMSNVKQSWTARKHVIEANTSATINLLEAVKKADPNIRVITIGSSEEYGYLGSNQTPISEDSMLQPINPYGVSKAAVSMLVKQYYKADHLNVIHLRPFNHIGPGQSLGFVTSDFAYQLALINSKKTENNQMKIGNLEAIRDFTDVRDIVEAYYQIAMYGKSGEIYNVCRGIGVNIQTILDILLSFSDIQVETVTDETKMRPSEVSILIGSNQKLLNHISWQPKIPLEKSLYDIYQFWLSKINQKL
ncbi:GDP-4-dehydro-6-deoxy-D-mannose reductase [Bacillus oleivorans]|uniref:GDP-4-dehydro-6-deoxy-D-mannose reductase n=1 Tax=Bacillus oleivorans TaxID=1448271 RepID=A0A285D507_9BACI|nr:GDP-mannose 4,6-dehydratase [Bacillus oleivorans]SNX74870.1 GDP-4-dehydro-6-deoxy-D-mannose reductase [Bacillus oleivorans]